MWVRDKLFIANRWVEPSGTRKLDVISPVTEKVVGRTPHAEFADVDRAVEAAQQAFQHGPWPRIDRKSTRLNSSHLRRSRMPSSA